VVEMTDIVLSIMTCGIQLAMSVASDFAFDSLVSEGFDVSAI
jgi:hypothetical protein